LANNGLPFNDLQSTFRFGDLTRLCGQNGLHGPMAEKQIKIVLPCGK
jgi:hypothetical protein